MDRASSSQLVPWATGPAADRLADLEFELGDPAAAVRAAVAAQLDHVARLDDSCLLLYAGCNVPAPGAGALHAPALAAQPSMGWPGDKYQAGLEPIDVVEVAALRAVAAAMGAAHAEVRPTSATMANLAVYAALAQPGDTIAVLPGWAGGHLSHHAVGAAGIRGLRVAELPYDAAALDVDVPALPAFLAAERPRLVVIGASLMLFPHDVPAIAQAVNDAGATLLYDASHVAGLLAERRFQAPLREGADLVTFSTYKSFGGPPGGAIVTDDARLAERVATAVYPGLTANYDAARMVPLATAALAHLDSAGGYADACVATARALGAALHGDGLPLVGAARGFTASHHLCVDARGFGGGKAAALRLAEAGILLSEIGLPVADGPQDAGGLRIGTQAIVRQGLSPEDAPAIAAVVARVLGGEDPRTVAPDVAAVRRRGT